MKTRSSFPCFLICFLVAIIAVGQPAGTKAIELDFQVFKTTEDTLTIEHIINRESIQFFEREAFPKIKPIDIYWIRVDFNKQLGQLTPNRTWYLYTDVFHNAVLYSNNNGQLQPTVFGSFQTRGIPQRSLSFYKHQLINGRYLYLKVSRLANRIPISKLSIYYASDTFQYFTEQKKQTVFLKRATLTYVYFGISLIIVLIALPLLMITKNREYLFYILYVIGMVFYLGRQFFGGIVSDFSITSQTTFFINIWVEILCNIFYILFVKYYLDTASNYPKLNKAIQGIIVFLLAITAIDSVFLLSNDYTTHFIFFDVRVVVISVFALLSVLYLLIYAKNKFAYFIVVGSLAYSTGSILLFMTTDGIYLLYGTIIEIIIFGFGLGYKVYLEQQTKRKAQQQAITNYMQTLRAQMNPHFIFNSLSSIQHLVLKNDTSSALKYLSKFSKLMRSTLESSIEKNVLLEEEIKLLHAYLELEKLRFEDDFNYTITVDKNMDTSTYEVPLLIVQPFVENAIIHGLLHKKEGKKTLSIHFSENEYFLICTIEDNGIGRVASQKLHDQNIRYKTISRGVELTEKRLKALYAKNTRYTPIIINDLYNEDGSPNGTQVIINIPKS